MRELLISEISPDTHDTDWNRWDEFVATRTQDDAEDTAAYSSYLQSRQDLFELVDQSSRLQYFARYNRPAGYFEVRKPDGDPRNNLLKTIRLLAIALSDDAQRLWIEGNRELAVKRLQTIIQMSMQMQLKPDATGVDILVAIATADIALGRMNQMLDTNQASDETKLLMLHSLAKLSGNDPIGLYCERTRTIRSYQVWLEAQLAAENGTIELWALIGRFLGIPELTQQIIDGPVGVPIVFNASTEDLPNPGKSIYVDAILDQVLEDLEDLDIKMLRESYKVNQPLVEVVINELGSGSPNIAELRKIQSITEDDETAIADILGLPSVSRMVSNYKNMLIRRDHLLDRIHSD